MSALHTLQQALLAAVRHTDTPVPQALHGDARADASARLAVYQHGYRLRLLEVLRQEYPCLLAVAGRDAALLLDAYIDACPSRGFDIRWHGAHLADFVASAGAWRNRPQLAEAARLDWAISTAFDAADEICIDSAVLAAWPTEQWAQLRLRPLDQLQILACDWNLDRWRRCIDHGQRKPPLRQLQQTRHVLVWRKAQQVHYRRALPQEAALLQAMRAGDTVGELGLMLEAHYGARAPLRLVALLQQWLGDGLLAGIAM